MRLAGWQEGRKGGLPGRVSGPNRGKRVRRVAPLNEVPRNASVSNDASIRPLPGDSPGRGPDGIQSSTARAIVRSCATLSNLTENWRVIADDGPDETVQFAWFRGLLSGVARRPAKRRRRGPGTKVKSAVRPE